MRFFPAIRPAPRSALIPYTTLFRSALTGAKALRASAEAVVKTPDEEWKLAGTLQFAEGDRANFTFDSTVGGKHRKGDRKSTRLNSSHRCISYAVFCLKKTNTATISY